MLNNPTLETLRALKLHGMIAAFEEQLQNPSTASLSFEERFGLLVDRERLTRENGRTTRLLRQAHLKHSQASVEDINYRADRKLDKRLIATLASGEWIRRGQGLLMTGKTGTGKSWLFCALARQACRQGRSVRYWRLARLLEQLRIAHADGSYIGLLKKIAKTDVIALDDWGLTPTTARTALTCSKSSTIVWARSPPPSSASCWSRTGTPISASRRSRMRSSIASCTAVTASHSPALRCVTAKSRGSAHHGSTRDRRSWAVL